MHVEDIKAGLKKRGFSLTRIAEDLDVDQSTVSQVIRSRRSKRIEGYIASALGKRAGAIWPDRYPKRRSRAQEAA